MRYVVITGGPNIHYDRLRSEIRPEDYIVCADSGASHARNLGLIPQKLIGDLDSIDQETLTWVRDMKVPLEVHPVDKDMTDTELCLRSVAPNQPVLLVCSFSGRPDHVLANYLLAGRLTSEGRRIVMTDGISYGFPISGPANLSIPTGLLNHVDSFVSSSVSLLPLFSTVTGVTTYGLTFALHDAELIPGSTFSVSNKANGNTRDISITIAAGVLLVLVTPED